MRDVNKVILIGRLGSDPVHRLTKTGLSVVSFPVATARVTGRGSKQLEFSVADGETLADGELPQRKKETEWHRCVAWGKQGVTCAQYLKKGSRVYIEGSVRHRAYVTEAGDQRHMTEIHTDEVSFLNSPRREGKPEGVDASQSGATH